MPIYQVKCEVHGKQEVYSNQPRSLETAPCPLCGRISPRDWTALTGFEPFKAYWTEALSTGPKPIEIRTREQERALKSRFGFERVS